MGGRSGGDGLCRWQSGAIRPRFCGNSGTSLPVPVRADWSRRGLHVGAINMLTSTSSLTDLGFKCWASSWFKKSSNILELWASSSLQAMDQETRRRTH